MIWPKLERASLLAPELTALQTADMHVEARCWEVYLPANEVIEGEAARASRDKNAEAETS